MLPPPTLLMLLLLPFPQPVAKIANATAISGMIRILAPFTTNFASHRRRSILPRQQYLGTSSRLITLTPHPAIVLCPRSADIIGYGDPAPADRYQRPDGHKIPRPY